MNTFNRVVLSIIFLAAFLASGAAALVALGVISVEQLQSVIPYQRVGSFFTANLTTAGIVSIAILLVLVALGILWLRGELSGAISAVTGGAYEAAATGPGSTTVDYDVVVMAINNVIRSVSGVVDSQTRIYSASDGLLFAASTVVVQRTADIHAIDSEIRNRIGDEWLRKLGSNLARHDIVVHLEAQERRVA